MRLMTRFLPIKYFSVTFFNTQSKWRKKKKKTWRARMTRYLTMCENTKVFKI